jgi:hypothetical protein
MEESGEHGGEGTGMRGGTSSRGGLRKTPSGGFDVAFETSENGRRCVDVAVEFSAV